MPWTWAALMPHPPIIVPEVGHGREREAGTTLDGITTLLQQISACPHQGRPDLLLILSPHQPVATDALFINTAPSLSGSLVRFGAPQISVDLQSSQQLQNFTQNLQKVGIPLVSQGFNNLTPDHSSQVPLYFFSRLWDQLPPVIVANPVGLTPELAFTLGEELAQLAPEENWALLASGDLSHRLTPEAPAGYDPEGAIFDRDLLEALSSGNPRTCLDNWPLHRLEHAGECGYRSALTLLGLAGGPVEVLSYEGPFGVGYVNAWWRKP